MDTELEGSGVKLFVHFPSLTVVKFSVISKSSLLREKKVVPFAEMWKVYCCLLLSHFSCVRLYVTP